MCEAEIGPSDIFFRKLCISSQCVAANILFWPPCFAHLFLKLFSWIPARLRCGPMILPSLQPRRLLPLDFDMLLQKLKQRCCLNNWTHKHFKSIRVEHNTTMHCWFTCNTHYELTPQCFANTMLFGTTMPSKATPVKSNVGAQTAPKKINYTPCQ